MQTPSVRRYRRGVPTLVAAAVLATAGCSGSDGSDAPAAGGTTGSSAAPTASASATAGPPAARTVKPGVPVPGATGSPSVAISRAPVVKIGKIAKLTDDVEVYVGRVREVTVKAENPGEIAGAAAAVPVTVRNTSKAPFSLNGMVVTASYGRNHPGDETSAKPSAPLTGSLAVGQKARGTYVFMVPRKYAATLHLEVSSDQSPTVVRFAR